MIGFNVTGLRCGLKLLCLVEEVQPSGGAFGEVVPQ